MLAHVWGMSSFQMTKLICKSCEMLMIAKALPLMQTQRLKEEAQAKRNPVAEQEREGIWLTGSYRFISKRQVKDTSRFKIVHHIVSHTNC